MSMMCLSLLEMCLFDIEYNCNRLHDYMSILYLLIGFVHENKEICHARACGPISHKFRNRSG